MKNKIFILFILIFMFMTGSVFAATTDLMTVNIAQDILDYYSDPAHITQTSSNSYVQNIETWKTNFLTNFSNVTAEEFTDIYNRYYVPGIEALNIDEHISFNNICIYSSINSSYLNLKFLISNNTASNVLGYTFIDKESSSVNLTFKDGYIYESTMMIDYQGKIFNNSISAVFSNVSYERTYPTINPTFDSNDEKIFINYQLALSPIQSIYYADNNKYYFVGNFINAHGEINSGDIESGDNSGDTGEGTVTPSGDNGETTTPDYSEKLDNIQGSIDNVNENLDNIENKIPTSGEVQNIINGTLENAFGEGSGELTGEQIENLQDDVNEIMGNIVPANNFIGMFNQIITAFSDALLGTGEELIEFDHRGEHYVISSNDINLPIKEIKAFITIFFNVAIIMAIALSINSIIRKMEEGDVISILHMSDADMHFYEDLNLF